MRRLFYLLPLVVFLLLATYFAVSLRPNHDIQELPSAMIGKPAPSFDLAALSNDKPLTLATLKRHPLIINFSASWCVRGRMEHPLLMRRAEEDHRPRYGIDYKDKPEDGSHLL